MDSNLNLDILPPEVVTQFLLRLTLKDLINYCLTSKTANEYCKDDAFWKDKYRYDFGLPLPVLSEGEKWINLYKNRTNRSSPISAGNIHYAMIDNKGILYMSGNNNLYQLGDGTRKDTRIPIRSSFFTKKIISVSCGKFFTIAITEDGKTYGWGKFYTPSRRIKLPTLIPNLENYKAIKVSCGGDGWAVILDNNSVYYSIVMIYDGKRIMGIVPLKEKVVDISVNSSQVGMVTSSGKLYLFGLGLGRNFDRKLRGILKLPNGEFVPEVGDSVIDPILFPHEPVAPRNSRARHHEVMVNLGEMSKSIVIKSVSLSDEHIMVLSTNGDIFSWGDNDRGQLGLNIQPNPCDVSKTPQKIIVPVKFSYIGVYDKISYAITTHGKLYIWGGDHYIIKHQLGLIPSNTRDSRCPLAKLIKSPLEINIGNRVNYVSFGSYFAIAVTEDGVVNYMGKPLYGPPN